MKSFVTLITLGLLFGMTPAYACYLNGQSYPPGTKVGTLTCQPDGTWR
jgi:hypothetical protein